MAEDRLFNRKVQVVISSAPTNPGEVTQDIATLEDLRVEFDVEQTFNKQPNVANVKIYNMSPEQRSLFQDREVTVKLYAGYVNTVDLVFSGDLKKSKSYKDGPDWVTELQCRGGGKEYGTRTVRHYRPRTRKAKVIKNLFKEMGLEIPKEVDVLLEGITRVYKNGKVVGGQAQWQAEKLLLEEGMTWQIRGNRVLVTRHGAPINNSVLTTLNRRTGMLGIPEITSPEKKKARRRVLVKSLLQPNIFPGSLIKVESEFVNEVILVLKAVHVGDTRSSEWFTEVEGSIFTGTYTQDVKVGE